MTVRRTVWKRLKENHQPAWDVNKWGLYFVGIVALGVLLLWLLSTLLGYG